MRLSLRVEGMTCVNCARAIEINLRRLRGIKDVQVSFELGRVYVEFDEELLSPKHIKEVIEALGYKVPEDVEEKNKGLWILLFCLSLTLPFIPLMFFHFPWKHLVEFLLASALLFVGGYSFYRSAYKALLSRFGNMDLLVALGSTSAYIYSLLSLLGILPGEPFFETTAFLITFVRIGKYLEERAKERATKSLRELFGLQTSKVKVWKDGKEIEKPIGDVFIGDVILLRSGELVPLDVSVLEGSLEVDESLITGESKPVLKLAGDKVLSGSVVVSGFAKAKVEKTIGGSYVSTLIKLIEESLRQKPKIQRIADRLSHYFVQVVILLSLMVFIFWFVKTGELQKSFNFALSVLVISCPCAFGIAVPLALTVGLLRAYKKGLLIKNPSAFERIEEINLIVLDKTGTLTEAKPKVSKAVFYEDASDIALSLSYVSNHPYSKAIRDYCLKLGASLKEIKNCKEVVGVGVMCEDYYLGRGEGDTLVLKRGEKVLAEFYLEEEIREDAKEVVEFLRSKGIKVVMITGDSEERAKRVAKALGIESFYAGVKPEEKLKILERYQEEGYIVGMVGDGINDAPAMAKAHLSFAVGSGTDVAKRVGDIILLSGIKGLKDVFELSSKVNRRIKENLFWAFLYNVLCIPIAGGLLSSYGIVLKPEIAGLAMSLSSLSVVINSVKK